jgi:hypothetical protein
LNLKSVTFRNFISEGEKIIGKRKKLLIFMEKKICKYFGNTVSTYIFKMVQNMLKPMLQYRSSKYTRGRSAKVKNKGCSSKKTKLLKFQK